MKRTFRVSLMLEFLSREYDDYSSAEFNTLINHVVLYSKHVLFCGQRHSVNAIKCRLSDWISS